MSSPPKVPTLRLEDKLFLLTYKHDKQSHISIRDNDVCLSSCGQKWEIGRAHV